MTVGRKMAGCSIMELGGESLLVIAGGTLEDTNQTPSTEILNLSTGTMSTGQDLPVASNKLLAVEDVLFMWNAAADRLYQYEVTSDQWMEMDPAPFDPADDLTQSFVPVPAGPGMLCQYV